MIKFSVIVVCLNAGDDLYDTVINILQQTYENYEIIIKDGFSTDKSVEKLPVNDKLRLIIEKDTGIYDAMNQAIERSTGQYTIFLNCGDLFYDTTVLEKTAIMIHENPAVIFYGDCYNVGENHYNSYPKRISEFTCYRTMICHQSTFYSSTILRKMKFDLSYKVLADKHLLVKAIKDEKAKNVYLGYTVCRYKAGGFCESEKSVALSLKEFKRIKRDNYSFFERILYEFILAISLKSLRKLLLKNMKFKKIYFKTLKMVYGLSRKKV